MVWCWVTRPVGFLNFANEACAARAIQKYQGWTGWGARGLNFEFVPGVVEDKSLKRTRDAFGKVPVYCCLSLLRVSCGCVCSVDEDDCPRCVLGWN